MEAVLESQAQLQVLFLQKMDAFQSELHRSTSATATSSSLTSEFAAFRTFIMTALKTLQDQISLLARESDNQEMRARRKMVLVHGVLEAEREDTAACVLRTAVEKLKLEGFATEDISRCHRMGRASIPDKPRPILVKFRSLPIRNKFWMAKTSLKGTGITISEFLTKPRHDAFMAARQRFGVTKCWTRDGLVHIIAPDGTRHRVSSLGELSKIQLPTSSTSSQSITASTKVAEITAPKTRRAAAAKK